MKTLQNHILLGATLMLGMTAAALAQSSNRGVQTANGSIRGEVLDPSGALIPQAEITITSANGFTRTLVSGPQGTFEVSNLAPGSYSVSIDAKDFTPALEGGIQVAGNKVVEENIKLGISVEQEIEVTADGKE